MSATLRKVILDQYKIDLYQLHPKLGQLHEALERLPQEQQIAFGLGCCERLHPMYTQVIAKQSMLDVIQPILDQLWEYLEGVPKSTEDLVSLRERANWLGVSDETRGQEYTAVYDCIGATYRTVCSCLENTVDHVVWAWTCCEDVVYQFLRDRLLDGFVGLIEPERSRELQAIINADPLMIREYEFAQRLLRFLSEHATITLGVRDAVTRMAQAEAAIP
jgi:hypothetical protein